MSEANYTEAELREKLRVATVSNDWLKSVTGVDSTLLEGLAEITELREQVRVLTDAVAMWKTSSDGWRAEFLELQAMVLAQRTLEAGSCPSEASGRP